MDVLPCGIFCCSRLYCHVNYFVALCSIATLIVSWQWMLYHLHYLFTTWNMCSFIGVNIFVGIDEYNSNYINWYPKPTDIWVIWFDFNQPHIFIGGATSPTNIHGLYSSMAWTPMNIWGSGLTCMANYICWLIDEYRRWLWAGSFSLCAHIHALHIVCHRRAPASLLPSLTRCAAITTAAHRPHRCRLKSRPSPA
jgi:hypothetical protein